MRVLVVSHSFPPEVGGIERLLGDLVPALAERGHELTVLADRGGRDTAVVEDHHGTPVHRLPLRHAVEHGDVHAMLRTWRRLVTAIDPHLIHLHPSGPEVFFHQRSGWGGRVPVVLTVHQDYDAVGLRSTTGIMATALRQATVVTAVSGAAAQVVTSRYEGLPGAVRTIPNAVPLGPAPVSTTDPCIAVVARLVPQKGVDVALRAMAGVVARRADARLVIAGDGPERPALERLAAELGIGGHVRFAGPLDRAGVDALYAGAAIVCLPSRYEGMPLVALEAAAAGRPVAASAVSGLPEVVDHGVTGLLVPPEDPDALAAALLHLLDDPAGAAALGSAARRRAEDRSDFAACVDAYDALYRELAGP